jgi:hypothetical protein
MRKRKIVRTGKPIATSLLYADRMCLRDNATTVGKCKMSSAIIHYPLTGRMANGAKCHINKY